MTEKNIESLLKKALSDEKDVSDDIKKELLSKIGEAPKKKNISFTKITRNAAAVAACFVLSICVMANVNESVYNVLSDIPVVSTLTKVLTFRTYEDEAEGFKAYMEFPEVEGLGEVTDEVNKEIEGYAEKVIRIYKEDKALYGDGGHYASFTGYDTVADNRDYFSLRLWTETIAATANHEEVFIVVDKKTEKIVKFSDLFPDGQSRDELKQIILAEIAEREKKNGGLKFFSSEEWEITGQTNFYISENYEVIICFDEYEIGPGAIGPQSFIVGMIEDGIVHLGSSAVGALNKLSGVVYDGTNSFVFVETDDGKIYEFNKEDVEVIVHGEGMIIGTKIDVYYEGSLENPVVKRIELY